MKTPALQAKKVLKRNGLVFHWRYKINKTLHGRLGIGNIFSCVEEAISFLPWPCNILYLLLNLVPRVFSLSNMAAAEEKTLAHRRLRKFQKFIMKKVLLPQSHANVTYGAKSKISFPIKYLFSNCGYLYFQSHTIHIQDI